MEFKNLIFNDLDKGISDYNKIYLIKFYSDNCDACKMVDKSIQKVYENFKNEIDFYKVDTDNEPKISQFFEVYCTPTIIIYKNKEILKSITGYKQSDELLNIIKNTIS